MSRDQVFISYSHEDRKWRDDIEKHLQPYLRSGSIESWSDRQITPGSEWLEEIQSALKHSKVAVLLVSPDFLASDFIHEHELGHLLKEAEHGGVRVLWIPVRESAYKQTPLKNYQAVLDPAKPLASMTAAERDQAWVSICEGIEKQLMAAWLDYSGAAASFPESVPDTPAALLDVLTSGEFPKQAEHRQAELRA